MKPGWHPGKWGALAAAALVSVLALGLQAGAGWQDPDDGDEPAKPAAKPAFIGNRSGKTFHRPDCALISKLSARSKVGFADAGAAEAAGFKACAKCQPADAKGPDKPAKPADDEGDDLAIKGSDPEPEPAEMPADMPKGKGARKKGARGKAADSTSKGAASAPLPGGIVFSRDIAPILQGNCAGCHNANNKAQNRNGSFDLTTFRAMQTGSQSGPVIVPGKPEESLLVELVATRKMPRGGNRRLSDEAIEKIQRWVADGAVLDRGVSPTETLDKIMPTEAQRRRDEIAKLPPEELDKRVEAAAQERWKKANAKAEPKVTKGRGFLLFSTLPEERAKSVVAALDGRRARLVALLGNEAAALQTAEKVSLYVFNDRSTYTEFMRAVEQREIEMGMTGHGRLGIDAPYVAVVDPLEGGADEPAAAKSGGRARTKKGAGDDLGDLGDDDGAGRSLDGLLTQHLASGLVASGGKAPRWLSEGLGAYLGAQVDGRGAFPAELRAGAARQLVLGWETKAAEALGDQGGPESLQAMGASLLDWIDTAYPDRLGPLIRLLAERGDGQFENVIKECFGPEVTREKFITEWGDYVSVRYGTIRRR